MTVSILCHRTGESFVPPLRLSLESGGLPTKFIVEDMNRAHASGDVVWIEWARGLAESFLLLNNRRLPTVVRVHRFEAYQPEFVGFPHARVGCYVVPTEHIAARVRKFCGETPVVVAPYGVDLAKFTPRLFPAGSPHRYGVVGALSPRKDVFAALRYFENEDDPPATIHFAGEWESDDYRDAVEYRLFGSEIKSRVFFDGFVKDIGAWWSDKNWQIHTAWHEGFPYAILEAAACGVRTVGASFPGEDHLAYRLDPRMWVEQFHDARKVFPKYVEAVETAKTRTR